MGWWEIWKCRCSTLGLRDNYCGAGFQEDHYGLSELVTMSDAISLAGCPLCRQGRLFAYREEDSGNIYLHCEECEWGWLDPKRLRAEDGFLTLDVPSDARPASRDEVLASQWRALLIGEEPPGKGG